MTGDAPALAACPAALGGGLAMSTCTPSLPGLPPLSRVRVHTRVHTHTHTHSCCQRLPGSQNAAGEKRFS